MWMESIRAIWMFKDSTVLEDRSERPRACKNRFSEFHFYLPSCVYCWNASGLDWANSKHETVSSRHLETELYFGTIQSSPSPAYTRMPQRPESEYILPLWSSHQSCWKEVTWKWEGKSSFCRKCSTGPPGTWYADGSRLVVMFDINQEILPVCKTAIRSCSFIVPARRQQEQDL